jgi:hypothetical protein
LVVADLAVPKDPEEAIEALRDAPFADVYNITSFMTDDFISLLYSGADAVLANSGHEPFGLVGLEVMAAAGVAFVGSTGEDYAVPYLNSVVLDTDDPAEINIALAFLRAHAGFVERLRTDAQETARSFTWENVIVDNLLGKLQYVGLRQLVNPPYGGMSEPAEPAQPGEPGETVAAGGDRGGLTEPVVNPPGGPAPESVPYGGEAAPRRLSVRPRREASEPEPGEPKAKPAAKRKHRPPH